MPWGPLGFLIVSITQGNHTIEVVTMNTIPNQAICVPVYTILDARLIDYFLSQILARAKNAKGRAKYNAICLKFKAKTMDTTASSI